MPHGKESVSTYQHSKKKKYIKHHTIFITALQMLETSTIQISHVITATSFFADENSFLTFLVCEMEIFLWIFWKTRPGSTFKHD